MGLYWVGWVMVATVVVIVSVKVVVEGSVLSVDVVTC